MGRLERSTGPLVSGLPPVVPRNQLAVIFYPAESSRPGPAEKREEGREQRHQTPFEELSVE